MFGRIVQWISGAPIPQETALEECRRLWEESKAEGHSAQEFLEVALEERDWPKKLIESVVFGGEGAPAQQWDADAEPGADDCDWVQDLLGYPSVLVYGPQGSGKSTLAEWVIEQRLSAGHRVEILDPHREFGKWDGLPVFGDGLDYSAIDERLEAFEELVKTRYRQFSQSAQFNPQPVTVLAEEFTRWASKCPSAAVFLETVLTDIRKVRCHVIFVSHARTMSGLGGAKGLAATRDASLLELCLEAAPSAAAGGQPRPTGFAWLKAPGEQPPGRRVRTNPNWRPSGKCRQPSLPTPPAPSPAAPLAVWSPEPQALEPNPLPLPLPQVQPETTELQGFRPLYVAVVALGSSGFSDSRIVQEILGFKGRRFAEGQSVLRRLRALGEREGW